MREEVFHDTESAEAVARCNSLHGTILRSTSVRSFILTETAYPPHLKLPEHAHRNAYFCFIIQGAFTEARGGRSRTCRAATLLFRTAGEAHSDHFHSRVHCLNLQIDPKLLQETAGLRRPVHFSGGSLTHTAVKLYREFREMDELSGLVIEGLALELIGTASRSARTPRRACPPWLAQARELLHENFAERVTLADVASAVGVHETHLAREFRRYYRCTVGEFVRRRRIEFACRQIAESDAPLSEVAVAAGFFDQSHFGRTFKLLTGMSPAAYRATFRAR